MPSAATQASTSRRRVKNAVSASAAHTAAAAPTYVLLPTMRGITRPARSFMPKTLSVMKVRSRVARTVSPTTAAVVWNCAATMARNSPSAPAPLTSASRRYGRGPPAALRAPCAMAHAAYGTTTRVENQNEAGPPARAHSAPVRATSAPRARVGRAAQ